MRWSGTPSRPDADQRLTRGARRPSARRGRAGPGRAPRPGERWRWDRRGRPAHKPVAGVHAQRGAEHEQRVGGVGQRAAGRDAGLGDRVAEEHDVGLEQVRVAAQTARDHEAGDIGFGELDVAVGADVVAAGMKMRVELAGPRVQRGSPAACAAAQADHGRQGPVELHDVATTCRLVKPVDVLRDHRAERAGTLQASDRAVAGIWPHRRETPPAHEGTSPVATAHGRRPDELVVLHRRDSPRPVGPAIVRDPGVGRHSGAREHEHVARRDQQPGEGVEIGRDGE
jgi:hypothetical protein